METVETLSETLKSPAGTSTPGAVRVLKAQRWPGSQESQVAAPRKGRL